MKKNIDSLDGLRAFACLLVVFGHLAKQDIILDIKGSGQLGVMLFFALSGFLMAHLYATANFSGKKLVEYGFRRCFRVLPAYVSALLIAYLITPYWKNFPYPMLMDNLIKHLKLQGDTSVFWTIPVEMKFYLFFPFLWAVLHFLKKPEYKGLFVFILFVISVNIFPFGERLDLTRYIEFFIGGVSAGLIHQLLSIDAPWKKGLVNISFVLSVVLIIIFIPQNFLKLTGIVHTMWRIPQLLAPLFAITVLLAANVSGFVSYLLSNRISLYLGKISFSLYLVHFPIIFWISESTFFSPIPNLAKVVLAIAGAVLLASLLYSCVEKPFRKIGALLNDFAQNKIA